MDNISQIAKFGRDPDWTLLGTPQGTGNLDRAARAWNELRRLESEFESAFNSISNDADLSPAGRGKARAAKASKMLADLAPVRKVTASLAADLEGRRAEASNKMTTEDRLLAQLQGQEIRKWLGDDALQNLIAANDAALADDAATLAAILDAPTLWPGKPEEAALVDLREQRTANVAGPEVTAETRKLTEAHRDLVNAVASTEAEIGEAAGLPIADPVAEQAAGDAEAA